MKKFTGFTDQETFTQVPETFFRQLLNEIEDADELKVTLYFFWRIEHMEGRFRSLCRSELVEDKAFLAGLGDAALDSGLEKAIRRGTLLLVKNDEGGFYFLNSPRGRAAAEAMQKGDWRGSARKGPAAPPPERPNIFRLYEENIGPLTPLLSDALKDAEQTYPPGWITEAFGEAVKQNKRSWKYVEAILRRWKEEGHAKEQDRRDAKEPRGRDVTRKVEDFLKH
ncbi:MAG TPA: DnaD domain protein [Anaerolineales bacterium]|nr:DnaD domain protein [Anaerolineales bacterium]